MKRVTPVVKIGKYVGLTLDTYYMRYPQAMLFFIFAGIFTLQNPEIYMLFRGVSSLKCLKFSSIFSLKNALKPFKNSLGLK